jgi:hypothetical protein
MTLSLGAHAVLYWLVEVNHLAPEAEIPDQVCPQACRRAVHRSLADAQLIAEQEEERAVPRFTVRPGAAEAAGRLARTYRVRAVKRQVLEYLADTGHANGTGDPRTALNVLGGRVTDREFTAAIEDLADRGQITLHHRGPGSMVRPEITAAGRRALDEGDSSPSAGADTPHHLTPDPRPARVGADLAGGSWHTVRIRQVNGSGMDRFAENLDRVRRLGRDWGFDPAEQARLEDRLAMLEAEARGPRQDTVIHAMVHDAAWMFAGRAGAAAWRHLAAAASAIGVALPPERRRAPGRPAPARVSEATNPSTESTTVEVSTLAPRITLAHYVH